MRGDKPCPALATGQSLGFRADFFSCHLRVIGHTCLQRTPQRPIIRWLRIPATFYAMDPSEKILPYLFLTSQHSLGKLALLCIRFLITTSTSYVNKLAL